MNELSDQQLKNLADNESRVVPLKDPARIATVPSRVFTDQEVRSFLAKVHLAVDKKISPKMKKLAEQIYAQGQKQSASPVALATTANGTWMFGAPEIALWLMGKAAAADPNPDNQNNYAAFLAMTGAEQAALPILMNLNQNYPENSTVLNYIGQAWFGLGDQVQAKRYLQSSVRFFATQSQSNFTLCLLEQASGYQVAARDAILNSIRQSFSSEKDQLFRQLGGSFDTPI